jgi:RNA polymerase sigma-70 factor, ECF subfamily
MLGSFAEAEDLVQDSIERAWKSRASYQGTAPLERWLYAIATNACLNALAQRRRRGLPQLEQAPAPAPGPFGETDTERWVTPAPDEQLFPDASELVEARETLTLAFVALLQRLPARQRAALLLKDVLGWSAEEVADALGLSLASVNSALHRARGAVAREAPRADEPSPETLHAFVRAWESRNLEALVALLQNDVVLAMPPHALWFRGVEAIVGFLTTPGFSAFWSSLKRLAVTRANGLPAVAFYRTLEGGQVQRHSIMLLRFVDGRVAEMTTFIGPELLAGFRPRADSGAEGRTVSGPPLVMKGEGTPHDE